MPTTYHAIPAAVLDALGGMMPGDAPVLMLCGDEVDLYHPLDPRCVNEPADIPDALLLLPQSAPALAAAILRSSNGAEPQYRQVVGWAVLVAGKTVTISSPGLLSAYADALPSAHLDAPLGLATLACILAEQAAGRPEGTWTPREVTL